jgi:hypothetical protein
MSLLWHETWEDQTAVGSNWSIYNGAVAGITLNTANSQASSGNNGGSLGYQFKIASSNTGYAYRNLTALAAGDSVYVGMLIKPVSFVNNAGLFAFADGSGNLLASVSFYNYRWRIEIYNSAGAFTSEFAGNGSARVDSWQWLVVEFKRSSAAGTADGGTRCWANGALVASDLTYDNHDRVGSGTIRFQAGRTFGSGYQSHETYYDDIKAGTSLSDMSTAFRGVRFENCPADGWSDANFAITHDGCYLGAGTARTNVFGTSPGPHLVNCFAVANHTINGAGAANKAELINTIAETGTNQTRTRCRTNAEAQLDAHGVPLAGGNCDVGMGDGSARPWVGGRDPLGGQKLQAGRDVIGPYWPQRRPPENQLAPVIVEVSP